MQNYVRLDVFTSPCQSILKLDSFKRLRNSYNIRLKPLNPAPNLVRQVSLTGDKNVGLKGVSQRDFSFIKSPP